MRILCALAIAVGMLSASWNYYQPDSQCGHAASLEPGQMSFCLDADLDTSGVVDMRDGR
ncbi:hypothetical protein [Kribbella italica]|uniref:Uncharacterized protein n=1 Tax=Kribbella italica TaxID=1540520 RepID=A0A7W9MRD7_9ACTN|nr:hypothetical protein [Kribbella italica]MBB5833429.1 hypothetical protein [Kribbella italica]